MTIMNGLSVGTWQDVTIRTTVPVIVSIVAPPAWHPPLEPYLCLLFQLEGNRLRPGAHYGGTAEFVDFHAKGRKPITESDPQLVRALEELTGEARVSGRSRKAIHKGIEELRKTGNEIRIDRSFRGISAGCERGFCGRAHFIA
ncbi:MAG: hypothetical protein ABI831_15820 [Betaproteobacteria bacterium]